jgi:hypothetical protein
VRVLGGLIAALALAAAVAAPASAAIVHLRGTAYEFNDVKVRLGGAAIRVAEDPALGATAKADGSYDLQVPDGRAITPYINAAGHHTIYLQTFRTGGQDLDNVNFQTPSDAVYGALAALLSVPVGPDGNPVDCAIVSTLSTRDVRDLPFDAFTAYGAHGVAGATASAVPALPAPIYFNKDVIPDRSQPRSSPDGGVIWTQVPAGTYTISAHHPTARFAPFTATCAAGRVVNANPPWGLHQLGQTNPTKISARWSGTRLTGLGITNQPKATKITVSCAGRACPLTSRTLSPRQARRLALRLRTGQTLSVLATAHGYNGKLVDYAVRARGPARITVRCVPLGERKPRTGCAPI